MMITGFHRFYCLFWHYRLLALLIFGPLTSFAVPVVIRSQTHPGVKVTFKETHICETTHGVRSYAGYITLPATLDPVLQPYESNLFFWFFESRRSPHTAPLTLWLQGGPGLGSTVQAVSGHSGPCVVQGDSESTVRNPWSWNGASNMLYLDQPVQTGFSYDEIHDGFMDMLTAGVDVSQTPLPASNLTVRAGKFGSQDPTKSANTTAIAAAGVAHFLELWFQKFNQYKRDRVNIWSQSYGGHFAPNVAVLLTERNKKCRSGHHGHGFTIGVDSVGLINGFIDPLLQMTYFPSFAVNNTYGIKAYDDSVADQIVDYLAQPGGCLDQAHGCQDLQAAYDPDNHGNNETVNNVCLGAFTECWANVYGPYDALSGRDPFDIAHLIPDSFPPPYAVGYLNNKSVQKALGAKINYTEPQNAVGDTFVLTGDYVRSYSDDLGKLLDAGVRVTMLHGDRDFRCNWFGGEAVSLSIPYSSKTAFAAAGYANVKANPGHVGGLVRQHDIFSFIRVFQAGHEVPYYQPETAYAIFSRTIRGRDIATGDHAVHRGSGYSTTGPSSVNDVSSGTPPPQAPAECYVDLAPVGMRCSEAQVAALADGTAVVVDRVVISPPA